MEEKPKRYELSFNGNLMKFQTEDRMIAYLLEATRPSAPLWGEWKAEQLLLEGSDIRDIIDMTYDIAVRMGFSYEVREQQKMVRKKLELEWLRQAVLKVSEALENNTMSADEASAELAALTNPLADGSQGKLDADR